MERPNSRGANNFVVGLFVFVALLVSTGFVVFMGGTGLFTQDRPLYAYFKDVAGLNIGAPVYLSGVRIGRVDGLRLPEGGAGTEGVMIRAHMSIYSDAFDKIHQDARVEITSLGVLGDKVLVLNPGSLAAPLVEKGATVEAIQPRGLFDTIGDSDIAQDLRGMAREIKVLVASLNEGNKVGNAVHSLDKTLMSLSLTLDNLNRGKGALGSAIRGGEGDELTAAIKSLKNILAKIEKGEGTLGALVNDPTLHEDLKVLLGGAERSKMVRFLIREALKEKE